jgi:hypothetical protein
MEEENWEELKAQEIAAKLIAICRKNKADLVQSMLGATILVAGTFDLLWKSKEEFFEEFSAAVERMKDLYPPRTVEK